MSPQSKTPRQRVEIETPHRQPSIEADVIVPGLQALFTGAAVGAGMAAVIWGMWATPFFKTWLVCACVCAGVAWLWRLGAIQETLWRIETVTDVDLDGDGQKGRPRDDDDAHLVMVDPYRGQEAQRREQEERLRQLFADFIRGCAIDTTARLWEKRIGREQYAKFRDVLIAQGYAAWNSGQDQRGGWRLTVPVEVILAAIFRRPVNLNAPALEAKSTRRNGAHST